jgi:hypothetical protein
MPHFDIECAVFEGETRLTEIAWRQQGRRTDRPFLMSTVSDGKKSVVLRYAVHVTGLRRRHVQCRMLQYARKKESNKGKV